MFYIVSVQFMQSPVLDFGLDHYVSEPFNYLIASLAGMADTSLPRSCR